MRDKICVVTGGSDGIGKEVVFGLARQGATVLFQGRDPDKGARVAAEIKANTGNAAVEFLPADFASLDDVRRFANVVLQRAPRIDVLINNAGGMRTDRVLTKDGYETTFAVNHLAPFLLTHLLLDRLKSSAPARIINTASHAHRGRTLDFDDLQAARNYSPMAVYGNSKLANILFTRALAKRLVGSGVTATCMHPGFVRTSFARDSAPVFKGLFWFLSRFARTPVKGAETLIYLASSPRIEGAPGDYYFNCKPIEPSPAARDDAAAERLWQVSEKLVGIA